MDTSQPLRIPAAAHPPKAKPDARPMRLALGAGGLAAISALATAVVLPPQQATRAAAAVAQQQSDTAPATGPATGTPPQSDRPIRYVQLLPGQTAPPGATVITPTASTSATVVVTVPAPGQKQPARTQPTRTPTAQNPPAQPPTQPTTAPRPPVQVTAAPKPPAPAPTPVATTQSGKVVP